jgi:hypothetical protein
MRYINKSVYLFFLVSFYITNAHAVDANSGLESARIWSTSKTSIQIQGRE